MEPKILEEDRDEWIYNSMKKYSNLYMFELEFPADVFEVIDEMSICLSGCQPYSKKTEILQLALPPKLFPKDIEEGLCKDRDFQIVSGGYASSNILQIKPVKSSSCSGSVVACTQGGENSVTLYQLGDENCAVIKEFCKLPVSPSLDLHAKQSLGILATTESSLFLGTSSSVQEWDLNSASPPVPLRHALPSSISLGEKVTKIKLLENKTMFFLGDNGVVLLHDLRTPSSSPISFTSSKSTSISKAEVEILFSFDTICDTVAILDSYGGYEKFDVRQPSPGVRVGLPVVFGGSGDDDVGKTGSGVLRDSFNIQFSPSSQQGSSTEPVFLVSGLDSSQVHILQGVDHQSSSSPGVDVDALFVHDGHSKRVTAAVFHPSVERLIFSASVDSMLHAWQYIQ